MRIVQSHSLKSLRNLNLNHMFQCQFRCVVVSLCCLQHSPHQYSVVNLTKRNCAQPLWCLFLVINVTLSDINKNSDSWGHLWWSIPDWIIWCEKICPKSGTQLLVATYIKDMEEGNACSLHNCPHFLVKPQPKTL